MAEKAWLREVGPRDGLQLVKTILTTEQKLEWCRREAATGVSEIEVTSFVPPHVVPPIATALVPNLKGARFAIDAGIAKINYVLSASEEHNLANVRRTTQDSIDDFARIVALRDETAPGRVKVGSGIATSYGCTISGAVSEKRVVGIAAKLLELGADEIAVADTVGYGNPGQVRRIMGAIVREAGDVPVAAHFHDTRGLGLANVTAALEVGVRAFDASLGGLGGCPFAPGASGNVDSEDTVFLLESLGFDTGIDIEALIALRRSIEQWLPGERFAGSIAGAGLPKTFRAPADAAA